MKLSSNYSFYGNRKFGCYPKLGNLLACLQSHILISRRFLISSSLFNFLPYGKHEVIYISSPDVYGVYFCVYIKISQRLFMFYKLKSFYRIIFCFLKNISIIWQICTVKTIILLMSIKLKSRCFEWMIFTFKKCQK